MSELISCFRNNLKRSILFNLVTPHILNNSKGKDSHKVILQHTTADFQVHSITVLD